MKSKGSIIYQDILYLVTDGGFCRMMVDSVEIFHKTILNDKLSISIIPISSSFFYIRLLILLQ